MRAAALVVFLGVSASRPALATGKAECISSSDLGQDLRDQGRLVEAKERFVACGVEACPRVVRLQCREWADEVERRIPTVLLRVRDAGGGDVLRARGTLDGAPLTLGLDGRSLPLDPGAHTFTFAAEGMEPVELQVMAREGEKDRWLDVTLRELGSVAGGPPAPFVAVPAGSGAGATTASRPFPTVPVLAAVLGGVAAAGGVSFGLFGADAKQRVDDMRASCAPACQLADVEAAKRQASIANVSLVVGAVALATAVGLLVWRPPWGQAPGPVAWLDWSSGGPCVRF